jgi:hypothetical protein
MACCVTKTVTTAAGAHVLQWELQATPQTGICFRPMHPILTFTSPRACFDMVAYRQCAVASAACDPVIVVWSGNDLYLVARRDPNVPYWNQNISDWPWELQHDANLAGYSLRSHRTSLFRVSQARDDVELIFDIPGCGDTAFPSIVRVDEHTYIIVNYTSPVGECADWPWIVGQIDPQGTQIYFILIEFVPVS